MANFTENSSEREIQPKLRPMLRDMKVGDELSFPIIRLKSVRTQASELSAMLDRHFQTWTDRAARLIWIKRLG